MAGGLKGECIGCRKTVAKSAKAVKCARCGAWSHGTCSGLVDGDYDFMLFRQAVGFRWYCGGCLPVVEEFSIGQRTISDVGETLAAKVADLVTSAMSGFSERVAALENKINGIESTSGPSIESESFADIVRKAIEESNVAPAKKEAVVCDHGRAQPVRPQSVLIVKPRDPVVDAAAAGISADDIEGALDGIPVNSFRATKEGNLVLKFPSDAVKENARVAITSRLGDNPTVMVSEPAMMLPKMALLDLAADLADADIIPGVVSKNEKIKKLVEEGFALSLAFSRVKDDHKLAVLKMAPEIRDAIISQERYLYIGRRRHRVHDRVWVTRCFHCQGFNHRADTCKQKDQSPKCAYCAGKHESRGCTSRNSPKCVNCSALGGGSPFDHYASSVGYPLMVAQKKRIIENTNYLSSKN